ncbi:erythromycin esterase family protein [Actinokineospora sp. NPDC004072]
MAERLFRDRADAGRALAGLLAHYRGRDAVVLGLPRGGVPVAHEVATALGLPLDVFIVRKLGLPGHPELAMGALASGGAMVLNDDVVRGHRVTPDVVRSVADEETRELRRRERLYRGDKPPLQVEGRAVILVDDGLATGASMRAAVQALRELRPGRLVVAVPTASASTCEEFGREVDEVICATTPASFYAVGQSYRDFSQTSDDEVVELLRAAPDGEAAAIRAEAIPVRAGVPADDALFDLVGDARFVLIGEASHGTHEFYAARAAMTRRLIEERGFHAVAVEADWPDAYRVNQWVRGEGDDRDAVHALGGFERFPAWMWRNTEVVEFLTWMRGRGGFYGLDLYSLHRSAEHVIAYLAEVDPAAADRARERYSCLDHNDDGQGYGLAAAFGAGEECERRILAQLVDLRRAPDRSADEHFDAERNAQLVQAAERYYRTMFGGRVSSWNLRDEHMADTLDALAEHITARAGAPAKIVVWAHNSHVGDARATELASRGELNLGQLARERHPGQVKIIGFTTYTGTATAADNWGGPADRKQVRPAPDGSVEKLFHDTGMAEFLLDVAKAPRAAGILGSARLERAIGVVYRPGTERQSHYFRARLSRQFDGIIHIDRTHALQPLERTARWDSGEPPESYPHAV